MIANCLLLPKHWSHDKRSLNLQNTLCVQTRVTSGNNGHNRGIYISTSVNNSRENGIFVSDPHQPGDILATLKGELIGFDRCREYNKNMFCVKAKQSYNWFEIKSTEFFHFVQQPCDYIDMEQENFVFTPPLPDLAASPNCVVRYKNKNTAEVIAIRNLKPQEELFVSRVMYRDSTTHNGTVGIVTCKSKYSVYPPLENISNKVCFTPEGSICYMLNNHPVVESAFAFFIDTPLTNVNRVTVNMDPLTFMQQQTPSEVPSFLVHEGRTKIVTLNCFDFEMTPQLTLICKKVKVNENGLVILHKDRMEFGELLCVDCNLPRTVQKFKEVWSNMRIGKQ